MEDDRISNLPDDLLCHILSFLRTKQSVATSILSSKWKSLWRSVPTLDLDYVPNNYTKEGYDHFIQTVIAVIQTLDLHQPIKKFRLRFTSYDDESTNINAWVNSVVQRGVQHIDLSICFLQHLEQPSTNLSAIFTCSTLVVLKLEWLKLTELKPFSSIDLPLLKVLHLDLVAFSELQCLTQLLSGCPVLEEFIARCPIFYYDTTGSNRELKTLPKLVKADISTRFSLMEAVKNVEFLRIYEVLLWLVHCSWLFFRKMSCLISCCCNSCRCSVYADMMMVKAQAPTVFPNFTI